MAGGMCSLLPCVMHLMCYASDITSGIFSFVLRVHSFIFCFHLVSITHR